MAKEVEIHLDAFVEPFSFPHEVSMEERRDIEREESYTISD